MTGVPRELAEHSLNINPGAKPVKQALRRFGDEKRRAIGKEIAKLLKARFIKEVIHTKWVANPVLVPKKNTKVLRMCVDYTGLNRACPKDPFPLPRIDQVIDSTAGSELLCFLDAYSGYHQIRMRESDQLATSFITPYGTYCYITMPFGLKNAGATYQRTMQKCLQDQLGRNVHAYVDDIVVVYRSKDQHKMDAFEVKLRAKYEVRALGECSHFLGIRIVRDRAQRKLWLLQDSYIDKLQEKFNVKITKKPKTLLLSKELELYAGTVTKSQIYRY